MGYTLCAHKHPPAQITHTLCMARWGDTWRAGLIWRSGLPLPLPCTASRALPCPPRYLTRHAFCHPALHYLQAVDCLPNQDQAGTTLARCAPRLPATACHPSPAACWLPAAAGEQTQAGGHGRAGTLHSPTFLAPLPPAGAPRGTRTAGHCYKNTRAQKRAGGRALRRRRRRTFHHRWLPCLLIQQALQTRLSRQNRILPPPPHAHLASRWRQHVSTFLAAWLLSLCLKLNRRRGCGRLGIPHRRAQHCPGRSAHRHAILHWPANIAGTSRNHWTLHQFRHLTLALGLLPLGGMAGRGRPRLLLLPPPRPPFLQARLF